MKCLQSLSIAAQTRGGGAGHSRDTRDCSIFQLSDPVPECKGFQIRIVFRKCGAYRLANRILLPSQEAQYSAQWGLNRVPYRSANPLQGRVAACLQIWESGRMSHEQHGFLQHTSAEELFVVHLCKKMKVR